MHERPRILVADDEAEVLQFYERALSVVPDSEDSNAEFSKLDGELFGDRAGAGAVFRPVDLTICSQGDQAVSAVEASQRSGRPFSVAFLDMRMPPGPSGLEAAKAIRQLDPDLTIVIVTGFSDVDPLHIAAEVPPPERLLYLQKPLHPPEVRQLALALTEKWQSETELRRVQEILRSKVSDTVSALRAEVAAHKQTASALRERERRLSAITESIQCGFIIIDPKTHRIEELNTMATDMIGRPRSELVGRVCHEFICPTMRGNCPVTDQGREVDMAERVLRRADGTEVPILKTVTRVLLDGVPKLVESFVDISVQKKAQREREQMEIQLRQSQKLEAMGTLAGGIAHDFNNLLAAILGCAELASLSIDDPDAVRQHLEEILRAAGRARDLVRQILTFSRRVDVERRPVKPCGIVEEVLALTKPAIPPNITLSCGLDGCDGHVMADPGQLHQVVMNLVTNAVHSMKPAGGQLAVHVEDVHVDRNHGDELERVHDKDCVRMTVADTGCGMDPLVRERIFEPFFTTKPAGHGTGMGLSTAHGIVSDCGGAILVASEVGKGTTFEVYLPVTEPPADTRESQEEIPRGQGEHVLFVDDEEPLVRVGASLLKRLNYTVTSATRAQDALDAFLADPDAFQLVITDQNMPEMTGMQLVTELLAIRPNLPVILSTGYSDVASPEWAAENGVKGYLTKPMSTTELARAVRAALDG